MPNSLQIKIGNELNGAAGTFAITLETLVNNMRADGMSTDAIRQSLLNDLNTSGPIFGSLKNQFKHTVKNGITHASRSVEKKAFESAGVEYYKWATTRGDTVCPDCALRHGEVGTLDYFTLIGEPGSGFSLCGSNCNCRLVPEDYKGENLDKPIEISRVTGKGPSVNSYSQADKASQDIKLNERDAYYIKLYTGTLHEPLNNSLRKGSYSTALSGAPVAIGQHIATVRSYTNKLTTIMDRLPVAKGTVYRGTRRTKRADFLKTYGDLKEGDVYSNDGFMSTSWDYSAPDQFYKNHPYRVKFKIESKDGRSIHKWSKYEAEEEVLFAPGSRFKITKIKKEPFDKIVSRDAGGTAKTIKGIEMEITMVEI